MRRTLSIISGLPAVLALGLLAAPGMTVSALQKQLAAGARVTVIDVRSPRSFAEEHIPGAINIPAALCPLKKLPPLGAVVVYGDGLGSENLQAAAAALAAKPGLKVEILDGGYAGWKDTSAMTTRGAGLKHEWFNYVTYAHVKSFKPGAAMLYDLRHPPAAGAAPLTDLSAEFPGMKRSQLRAEVMRNNTAASPLVVLVDNGDGTAEQEARLLKVGGVHNYVILAGGEHILARHGQAGLQYRSSGSTLIVQKKAGAPKGN